VRARARSLGGGRPRSPHWQGRGTCKSAHCVLRPAPAPAPRVSPAWGKPTIARVGAVCGCATNTARTGGGYLKTAKRSARDQDMPKKKGKKAASSGSEDEVSRRVPAAACQRCCTACVPLFRSARPCGPGSSPPGSPAHCQGLRLCCGLPRLDGIELRAQGSKSDGEVADAMAGASLDSKYPIKVGHCDGCAARNAAPLRRGARAC
jgi:hypothetical protein